VVEVTLNGAHIQDSPFSVAVRRNPDLFDPSKTTAYGPGLEAGNTTAEPSYFFVKVANGKGETLKDPEQTDRIAVKVLFGEKEIPVVVSPQEDGTLKANYQAVEAGPHTVEVIWKPHPKLDVKVGPEHVEGSPYTVEVEPGTDAAATLVFGPGLEENVFDTIPATFSIRAKDKHGNDIPKGGDPFIVEVTDDQGRDVPVELKDNGDGSYDGKYAPLGHGRHKVAVKLRGRPVGKSPYTVDVREGATEASFVEKYSFVIRTRGRGGNLKTTGGDMFDVVVEAPSGQEARDVSVEDLKDGRYIVSYGVDSVGEYVVRVRINSKDIAGSPWRQNHFHE